MITDQPLISGILIAKIEMLLLGRFWRDVVALAALMACVIRRLVVSAGAFSGFKHPAVITLACLLVLSRGPRDSGALDSLARGPR